MATDLHKVFQAKFCLKNDKMTKSSDACQSFKITGKALKLLGIICHFMYFLKK